MALRRIARGIRNRLFKKEIPSPPLESHTPAGPDSDAIYEVIRQELGRPLVLLDIGARFGVQSFWAEAMRRGIVKVYALEPDEAECERLNKLNDGVHYIPFAVGDATKEVDFYITKHPGAASVLEPDLDILSDFPIKEYFEIDRVRKINLRTIDELIKDGTIQQPDIIKIDVQGFEYQVLSGAKAALKATLGVQLETHLKPIYKNQKLFNDLLLMLRDQSFDLCHLEPSGPFEGEVMELEAFFYKKVGGQWVNDLVRHFWLKTMGIPNQNSMALRVINKDHHWFLSNKYVTEKQITETNRFIELGLVQKAS